MHRMIAFIAALLCAPVVATAQTFPRPPDVAPYVAVAPTYQAGTAENLSIDARVTSPPQTGLADIPTSQTGRVVPTGPQCDPEAGIEGCTEAKFRTMANVTKVLYDDPIRNYGQPGASHCHMFFGNYYINAWSTFARLRNAPRSFAGGAELNGTGYWFPCITISNPFGNGRNYAVQPDYVVIYYNEHPEAASRAAHLPLGLRYVTGFNMDDADEAWLQAYIDAANAQPGTPPNRYRLRNPSTGVSGAEHSWSCNGVVRRWLRNEDGSDPWAGACTSSYKMLAQISGARCWDGVNLWSPGGYRHVITAIWDTYYSKFVCPTNYWTIPALQLNMPFTHSGFSDYGRWRLDSDDHAQMTAGRTIRNGESFHTDWMSGWDGVTMRTWLENCIGVAGTQHRQCNDNAISDSQSLIRANAAPNGRNPQVDIDRTYSTANAADMFRIRSSPANAPATVHAHGTE